MLWTPINIPGWKRGMHRLFRLEGKDARHLFHHQRLYLADDSGEDPEACSDGPLRIPKCTHLDTYYTIQTGTQVWIDVCCEDDVLFPNPELDESPDGAAHVALPVAVVIARYHGLPEPTRHPDSYDN